MDRREEDYFSAEDGHDDDSAVQPLLQTAPKLENAPRPRGLVPYEEEEDDEGPQSDQDGNRHNSVFRPAAKRPRMQIMLKSSSSSATPAN